MAAMAALSLLGTAPSASASPDDTQSDNGASRVIARDKYGDWTKLGPPAYKVKCRVYAALSVSGRTIRGVADGQCKRAAPKVTVSVISINGRLLRPAKTTLGGGGKYTHGKILKKKNPRGKQKICVHTYVNHPGDDSTARSEAKVCIRA
ncbi:hypothetical protein [Streptomyces sp. NPDC051218]|uniref:hypothetical protein n=1 Tax=Streptomyces sp. NPDC051218 TaxID=3365645 RepID=UPI0037909897